MKPIDIIVLTIVAILAILFGVPIILQLLWNWAIVSWLDLPPITYWQAFGAWVLWEILWAGKCAGSGAAKKVQ